MANQFKKIEYVDVPIAFDIESTSMYLGNDKKSFMYVWMIDDNDELHSGRTWMEFAKFYLTLVEKYKTNLSNRICLYVHNLSFEFQFIRNLFTWDKVFCVDERKVVQAVTTEGVEFRCSYLLTGKSLAKLAEDIGMKKMVGDLDYSLIRNDKTPLSEKEWGYCWEDVRIVKEFIAQQIEKENGIKNIPLTKTGYVRRYCRNHCFENNNYKRRIRELTVEPLEYLYLKQAFQGGFTHASASHNGDVVEKVTSIDFTSAYPAVMLSETFPMGRGRRVQPKSKEEFELFLLKYHCLIDVRFHGIVSKFEYETYISKSKCIELEKEVVDNDVDKDDNGRIINASKLRMILTEIDYELINKLYDIDNREIIDMYVYDKGYLPKELLECVLYFYKNKTKLKGVKDAEEEYMLCKELLNACYGMMVTDIVRMNYTFKNDVGWLNEKPDLQASIESYNKNKNRFLYYPWGVWVTAYNRRNLWSAIMEFKSDYIYSDTDSVKGTNFEKHESYVEKYNKLIESKLRKVCEYYDLDWNDFEPETIKGTKKLIGVWDNEGTYDKFKTLGAKRYMVLKNGEYGLTVSGLNKKFAMPYIEASGKPFEFFNEEMYIPKEYTGKQIHTYIDDCEVLEVTDYLGNVSEIETYGGVHLEQAEFNLKISDGYKNLLMQLGKVILKSVGY